LPTLCMPMGDTLRACISKSQSLIMVGNGTDLDYSGTSLLTTFKLPLSSSSRPLQQITLTMSAHGPNSRQDAPHPHETVVDPTGAFVLVPDLGADLIRIYTIDPSSGKLTSCGSSVQTPGTGPRHAAFYGNKTLFVANELANTVNRFSVEYTGGCITLTKEQSSNTMAGGKAAPSGTKVGEVHVHDDFIIVSNRRDLSFSPDDSMATFSLDPTTSAMTLTGVTSSGGTGGYRRSNYRQCCCGKERRRDRPARPASSKHENRNCRTRRGRRRVECSHVGRVIINCKGENTTSSGLHRRENYATWLSPSPSAPERLLSHQQYILERTGHLQRCWPPMAPQYHLPST
jgi:hypothetical protein